MSTSRSTISVKLPIRVSTANATCWIGSRIWSIFQRALNSSTHSRRFRDTNLSYTLLYTSFGRIISLNEMLLINAGFDGRIIKRAWYALVHFDLQLQFPHTEVCMSTVREDREPTFNPFTSTEVHQVDDHGTNFTWLRDSFISKYNDLEGVEER